MEKQDFLLEIGVEEIPARFLQGILDDCAEKAKTLFLENRLAYDSINATGSMRRIVLFAKGLPAFQSDICEELKGPPKNLAFDAEGKPTRAASGFAASNKASLKDLVVKECQGREYVYVVRKAKGASAKKVLKKLLPELISKLYLPISMKWGAGDHVFIRPVHYILSMLGRQVVPFASCGTVSGNRTKGHRFLSGNRKAAFQGPADQEKYAGFLSDLGVVLDSAKRRQTIEDQIKKFEAETKEQVVMDGQLLTETANLVENPVVLTGKFDQQFIVLLPQDVIFTVVKKQQKCFPVKNSGSFLIVADGKREKAVSAGYEQVVNARLNDAKFFYDEDIRVPFESYVDRTKKIVYLEKIGSVWDKTRSVMTLSKWIAADVLNRKDIAPLAERVAELCKADLVTHMVGEFSSLAGIMGREYSLVAGEDSRVSRGIYEHYLPRHAQDELPQELPGAVVGIADRIDSLVSCFVHGIIPTGSEDPYGLRRAASGIVSIILGKNLKISLSALTDKSMQVISSSDAQAKEKIISFIKARLKGVLEEENIRYDVADAVLENADDLTGAYCMAFELMKSLNEPWFKGLVLAADRICRIAGKSSSSSFSAELFAEQGEKDLHKSFCQIRDIFRDHMGSGAYPAALAALKELTQPVDLFFEKVLVMHQDEKIRANRLAFLKSLNGLYNEYADFSKIVVQH